MADQVQAALDQMVTPLKDLLDRGIFCESEIRSIVSRRRESEYLLRRRAARKADFLRYLEAEMALERLRALRARRIQQLQKRRNKNSKVKDDKKNQSKSKQIQQQQQENPQVPIGDVHIIQHVHLLFVRALRKFKGDVSLYLQHAAFCRQAKSYSRLTRVYAEAIQLHPKQAGLWIEAASHEYFGVPVNEEDDEVVTNKFGDRITTTKKKRVSYRGGGSVQNARILLQRGLRVNPTSQELWLQAFGLELHFIQKLQGRKLILFSAQHQADESTEDQSHKEHAEQTSLPPDTALTSSVSSSPAIDYTLPILVYNNAVRAIPLDVTFRMKFVDLCQMFPSVDVVRQHIIETLQRDFQHEPAAWIARAAFVVQQQQQQQQREETGFLRSASDDDDDDDRNKNVEEGDHNEEEDVDTMAVNVVQPKKRSRAEAQDNIQSDPLLAVLTEATETIPTPEMLLQVVQFAQSYARSLLDNDEDDDDTDVPQSSKRRHDDDDDDKESSSASATACKRAQVVHGFINQIFEKATTSGIQSAELALEHADFLLSSQEDLFGAIQVLQTFAASILLPVRTAAFITPSAVVSCKIWIRWAALLLLQQEGTDSADLNHVDGNTKSFPLKTAAVLDVLRKGLKNTPMTASSDYLFILLHLMCGILTIADEKKLDGDEWRHRQCELEDLFQQLLLLAPRHNNASNLGREKETLIATNLFGPVSVVQACLRYLRAQKAFNGIEGARRVYQMVLFQHQLPSTSNCELESWKDFVDECLQIEFGRDDSGHAVTLGIDKTTTKATISARDAKRKRQCLDRLYRLAMELFQNTSQANFYKQQREANVLLPAILK